MFNFDVMNVKCIITSLFFLTLISCNENKNQQIIKKDVSLSFKNIRIGCPSDSITFYLTQQDSSTCGYFTEKSVLKEPSYLLRSDFREENRTEKFNREKKRVYTFPTYLINLNNEINPIIAVIT